MDGGQQPSDPYADSPEAVAAQRRHRGTPLRVTAILLAVLVGSVVVIGVGAAMADRYLLYPNCPGPAWQDAAQAEAQSLAPAPPTDFSTYTSDCDDSGVVSAEFSSSDSTVFDTLTASVLAHGWQPPSSDPAHYCWEKDIDGVRSSLSFAPYGDVRMMLTAEPCRAGAR